MDPNEDTASPNTRLVDAVRQVKIAAAERNDVVVDMKEADRARLDLLAQRLQPVFDEVPADDERFDFALSSGLQPRLWIDATAHVMMGRDRRTYRFVRDTRLGRIILAEAVDAAPVVEAVTTYIAERLHEREMAFAADETVSYRAGVSQRPRVLEGRSDDAVGDDEPDADIESAGAAHTDTGAGGSDRMAMSRRDRDSVRGMSPIGWFVLGLFVACGVAVLYYRDVLIP
ncbi:hypothetical protein [Roseitalea porphyridii]|uniref:hypothetical protein n=1 Tax=Roseitalea porphyridii TaxID=1852022 RepID=UPI0018643C33|nr:hypothetical protein [Roseitalea porphyridii]